MKKSLFFVTLAGLALASCTTTEVNDVIQKQEKQKITFESPLAYNNSSRVVPGEIDNPYPRTETFAIYATEYVKDDYKGWGVNIDSEGVGFNGNELHFDTSVDGWAPKKAGGGYYYWTEGNYMAFGACSPFNIGSNVTRTYDADGLNIQNFVVKEDPSEQYDLMFAKRLYDQSAANLVKVEGQYAGIQLTFQHALSSIHFSILNETLQSENTNDHVNVILKKITVTGVYDKGDFKENIVETQNSEGDYIYDRNSGGNVSPDWYNQTYANGVQEYVAYEALAEGGENLYFPSTAQYVSRYIESLVETNGDAYEGKYGEAIPLILLPQTLSDDSVIKVDYLIEGEDEITPKTVVIKNIKDDSGNSLTPLWNVGTKYTYRLVYSKETAKKDRIYFAPSVENWIDGGIISVYL